MIGPGGIEAILVKVAGAGLVPEKHLGILTPSPALLCLSVHQHSSSTGKTLATLAPVIARLHEKYELDYCGEGGEYESFVIDCPLFRTHRIEIIESEVVLDDEDPAVGNLRINKCRLVSKETSGVANDRVPSPPLDSMARPQPCGVAHSSLSVEVPRYSSPMRRELPGPKLLVDSDGYCQSPLLYPSSPSLPPSLEHLEAVAVDQLTDLFHQLVGLLESLPSVASASLSDAVCVHLYLSDMSLFDTINSCYCASFRLTKYPPSRVCVEVRACSRMRSF
jgi:diphthine-ammonia ligase